MRCRIGQSPVSSTSSVSSSGAIRFSPELCVCVCVAHTGVKLRRQALDCGPTNLDRPNEGKPSKHFIILQRNWLQWPHPQMPLALCQLISLLFWGDVAQIEDARAPRGRELSLSFLVSSFLATEQVWPWNPHFW